MNLKNSGNIKMTLGFCVLLALSPSSFSIIASFSLDESSADMANCVLWSDWRVEVVDMTPNLFSGSEFIVLMPLLYFVADADAAGHVIVRGDVEENERASSLHMKARIK